jgi:hypothetical protein
VPNEGKNHRKVIGYINSPFSTDYKAFICYNFFNFFDPYIYINTYKIFTSLFITVIKVTLQTGHNFVKLLPYSPKLLLTHIINPTYKLTLLQMFMILQRSALHVRSSRMDRPVWLLARPGHFK